MGRRVRWERPARPGERGAAAVEFALILPLLMVVVFGIINFGDMLSVRQSVSQAAAEGARAAAVHPGSNTEKIAAAEAAVADALDAHGEECVTGADGCSVVIGACASGAECATVEVVIDYETLIPGFGLVLPETLSYSAVARVS
ncbi:TadE/TadG family type IV pilus assembly protein [Nocardioides sp. SYSU DS0651]|uniref:TadE/TadG family type IV pilus assembly protein n=1 Tax=Nocardioides sp. SYSU DS0651 TaxID=3415955 RepID=UPI003F4C3137